LNFKAFCQYEKLEIQFEFQKCLPLFFSSFEPSQP
jgi:hypothetical protein